MTDPTRDEIKASCTRFLSYHHPHRTLPHRVFAELAASTPEDVRPDAYGEGAVIESFEREVAELLGKPAAVFMPSGTMAQQIALRIWSDRAGRKAVAFHPTCHLERHEHKGYQALHGLRGVLVGSAHELITLADLKRVAEPLAALLLELPQREIGGRLPPWEDVCEAAAWARERGIALHLDGARLWETKPFYRRDYAAIAGLFDSVYVSFYKGLGGIAGCALAGPADFIAEARIWQRRHGGSVVQLFPYVIAARTAMAERLERMEAYYKKAVDIAKHLADVEGIEVVPDPPHTNMMHVLLRGERAKLDAAALEIAREKGTWLFRALAPTSLPSRSMFELVVGDATMDLTSPEIAALLGEVVERARVTGG
jgi:threonine aldolase